MPTRIDLTGRRFGRLRVLGYLRSVRGRTNGVWTIWKCRCACGVVKSVEGGALRNGRTKSCGCLRRKHGYALTRTYNSWKSMKERCGNPNHVYFCSYGGRGIKVCKRWSQFRNFLTDMGERPKGTTLDRIKNNKGYSKSNCRWSSPSQQQKNRRDNVG